MSYTKAHDILPENLLREIQKYIQGEFIYIPNTKGVRKKWGQNSGNREYLESRNNKIFERFLLGTNTDQLAKDFCLSVDSIRKIVYAKRKESDCRD